MMMRIGEVAKQAGVNMSLIRSYEEIGLLAAPQRVSGQRRYDRSVLRRVAVVDVARRAGTSLDELRLLLEHGDAQLSDQPGTGCGCETIDASRLFDAPAAAAHEAPFRLPVNRVPAGSR